MSELVAVALEELVVATVTEEQVVGVVTSVLVGAGTSAPGGGSAHTIQDEGSSLTDRAALNFTGPDVTATDNLGAGRTDVTVDSSATAAAAAAAAVSTHEAAGDPHPVYLTSAEGNAAYDALGAAAAAQAAAEAASDPVGSAAAVASDLTTHEGIVDGTAHGISGLIAAAVAGYQPLDSDLTAIAALTTTAYGRALLELADAAATRALLSLVPGTDVQAYSALLGAIAGLTPTNGYVIQGNGSTFVMAAPSGGGLTLDEVLPYIIALGG